MIMILLQSFHLIPTSSGDESITSATLTVDLSVAPRMDVTVDYVVTGTATGSGQDYTLADGTLSISSWRNIRNYYDHRHYR